MIIFLVLLLLISVQTDAAKITKLIGENSHTPSSHHAGVATILMGFIQCNVSLTADTVSIRVIQICKYTRIIEANSQRCVEKHDC